MNRSVALLLSLTLTVALPGSLLAQDVDRVRVGDVAPPTLVLTGEWEMPYVQVVAEALAYGIPGAERAVVRGGGHAVHLQEPERFTAEVVRFLRGAGVR
jgi:pimeloyl-ACP methyl ester carboxylesterase